MRNLRCLDTIILDDLVIQIDLSDSRSWNLNTGLTGTSISRWSGAYSDNIFLYDFGLTEFDNGRANKLYKGLQLRPTDTKFQVYPVSYNTATAGPFLTGITKVISGASPFVGNYFQLNGGYLQGFYKLHDFNFEVAPARYDKGFTMETIVKIGNNSYNNGYIFYMGTRAEDKYRHFYSGETSYVNGIFDGVFTSEDNFLHSYVETTTPKLNISDQNHTQTSLVETDGTDSYDNVFGLQLLSDQSLAFTKINKNGVVQSYVSEDQITRTGWTIITLVFKPNVEIGDKDLLACEDNRTGTFDVYVNGRLFWGIEEFEEFFTKPLQNTRDKQIGVPYNISWGGGSFGLKNSWHYNYATYSIYTGQTQSYLTGFTEVYLPSSDPCVDNSTGAAAFVKSIGMSANTTYFTTIDECDVSHPEKVWALYTTGVTVQDRFQIKYKKSLNLLSNRKYVFTLDVYDNGVFNTVGSTANKIGLKFSGTTEVEVLEQTAYDGFTPFQWNQIRYVIKTKDNTGLSAVNVSVVVDSDVALHSNFSFYIADFKYVGQDILKKDLTKSGLSIETNFSKSFIGGIQKLRIYDVAFNSQEVLHNAIIESGNAGYDLRISRGGRIIYY